jgi:hypothetical protein
MPNGTSVVGTYGIIPDSILKQKFEKTNIQEDDYQVHDYLREQMKDFDCDKPFFESDQIRYDNHSEERLSLRHEAHRTGEVPDAPDLFLELTERDPRGTALDPNFRKLIDQSYSRADYFKFYDDSDNSVQESVKHPGVLLTQLRNEFENIKSRLKIFSTSKDHMMSAANYNFSGVGALANTDSEREGFVEGTPLTQISSAPRADLVTIGSNVLPMGWDTTSDLEYKVASYGLIRQAKGSVDVPLIQHDTDRDSAKLTTFQDQVVSVGLAQLMKSVALEHHMRYDVQMDQQVRAFAQATPSKYLGFVNPTISKVSGFQADQELKDSTKMIERFLGQLGRQSGMAGQDIETQLSIIGLMDSAAMSNKKATDLAKIGTQIQTLYTQASTDSTQIGNLAAEREVRQSRFQASTADLKWRQSFQVANLGAQLNTERKSNFQVEGRKGAFQFGDNQVKAGKAPEIRQAFNAKEGDVARRMERSGIYNSSIQKMGDKRAVRAQIDRDGELNALAADS